MEKVNEVNLFICPYCKKELGNEEGIHCGNRTFHKRCWVDYNMELWDAEFDQKYQFGIYSPKDEMDFRNETDSKNYEEE